MNYKLGLFLMLFIPFVNYAQSSKSASYEDISADSVPVTGDADYTLGISYFGNTMFRPGVRADLEKSWKIFQKTKPKNSRRKGDYLLYKSRELLPVAGAGFFVHPRQYTAVFADAGIKFRKTRSKSFRNRIRRWGASTGFGVFRSFLPETYEVNDDEVKKVFLAGRTYVYPYLALHTEKSWRKNPNHAYFATFSSMFLMPYNTTVVPLLHLQIGYRFKFKKFQKNHEKSI